MGQFTWKGVGALNLADSWLSGGTTATVAPGGSDATIFPAGGGTLSGSLTANVSLFGAGGFILSGSITDTGIQGFVISPGTTFSITSAGTLTAAGEQVSSGGSMIQHGATNAITGSGTSLYVPGAYIFSGGILSGASAAEVVSGTFKQISGANTIAEILIDNGGTYALSNGTLAVISGTLGGNEFVGLVSGGSFIQGGGSHTVANALTVGYGGSGTYTLTSGTLSVPISGTPLSPTGEYIGENADGQGVFIQTGGTNSVADRIVIGTFNNGGPGSNTSGTYTLGGSGHLNVQTLFVGSEQGCSGTFNFNSAKGDKASLNISGNSTIFSVGLIVGGDGVGTFVQGGGTLDTSLQVGRHSDGVGAYFLKSGTLKTDSGKNEWVGADGSGTFIQSGGSNIVSGSLFVASGGSAVGQYDVDSGSTLTVTQHIQLGVATSATGFLNLDPEGSGGKVTVSATDSSTAMTVGSAGTGTFNMTNGSARLIGSRSTPVLDVGALETGKGTVRINGGILTVTGPTNSTGSVIVGDSGSGTYLQTAGSATFGGDLVVGNGSTGDGTFDLNGTGSTFLRVGGNVVVGSQIDAEGTFNYDTNAFPGTSAKLSLGSKSVLTVGDRGSGTFNQDGGQITASGLDIGDNASGTGTFNLSAGTLTISSKADGSTIVGDAGTGTVVQSGGTANFAGGLIVGTDVGGTGNYKFSAGRLTVGSGHVGAATIGGDVGVLLEPTSGSGTFTQGGGTGIFNGGLVIGVAPDASGSFTLSGGTDTFSATAVVGTTGTGTFTETGGTATFANNLTVGINSGGSGTFDLTGSGKASVKGEIIIGGAKAIGEFDFNDSGGSATLGGSPAFKVGIGGTGDLNLDGGVLSASDVGIGNNDGSLGSVDVSGSKTKFLATSIEIGNFSSSNSTSAGVGYLTVESGGYVSVAKTLTLNDFAVIDSAGSPQFSGNISLLDGSLEVGGHGGGLAANTLQIDAGGVVVGHGQVQGLSPFNAIVAAGGRLEAKAGLLDVDGNVSGKGAIQIDANSTLLIGGGVAVGTIITFSGASGGVRLDDAGAFGGTLSGFGKTPTQFIDLDQIASNVTVSLTYTPNSAHPTAGGLLTVSSGGVTVANFNMVGSYTRSSFHLGSGADGGVIITDPPVSTGGTVVALPTSAAGLPSSIGVANVAFAADPIPILSPTRYPGGLNASNLAALGNQALPPIAFGAGATLGYSTNASQTESASMTGASMANWLLFAQHMAAWFMTAGSADFGTAIKEMQQDRPLLTPPHA